MTGDPEPRRRILEAAERIVLDEGPDKLRVTNVARALGMSHANVYRFFASRQALVDAVAERWIARSEAVVRDAIATQGTAAERLEGTLVAMARYKLHQLEVGADQVVRMVLTEATGLAARHLAVQHARVTQLLAEGNVTGEFDVPDPVATAGAVLDATLAFTHPAFVSATEPRTLEDRARAVARLLVRGLRMTPDNR